MRSSDPASALPRRPSPGVAGARLAELYEEHARMVFGISRLMLRDSDEAEDAAQQVFLSAYRSLLAGTEPRNAGAWLGTIARNESRDRIATRRMRPVGLEGRIEPASPTLEEQTDARADLAELRDQLAALPEKQREAVVLRDVYGLRYDEVARALNTSRPAVEALLFRGRRRLQQRLRPGLAAGVLVVPLALRESIAYAVPGFAAGGASTVGVLAKLAAVPVAAKLAAASVTVGLVGSAGVIAERDLRDSPGRPVPQLVDRDTPEPRLAALQPVAAAKPTPRLLAAASVDTDDTGDDRRELEDSEDDAPKAEDDDRDEPEEHAGDDENDVNAGPGSREDDEEEAERLEPDDDDADETHAAEESDSGYG